LEAEAMGGQGSNLSCSAIGWMELWFQNYLQLVNTDL
jgi:hypothetical protein